MKCGVLLLPLLLLWATTIYGNLVNGEVYVTDEDFLTTITSYRSTRATFGQAIPDNGIRGRAVIAHPRNACQPIDRPPHAHNSSEDPSISTWVVVIRYVLNERYSFSKRLQPLVIVPTFYWK